MKNLTASIVALLAVLSSAELAQAEGVARVGVVVATRVNVTEAEADALADTLGDALRDRLVADVVAGAEARRRLPPGGVQEDCVARAECVSDIAERLGADQILFLVVVRIGPRVQIDSTFARPSTGQVVSRAAVVIDDGKQGAPEVFAAAARRFLPGIETRPVTVALPAAEGRRRRHVTRGAMIAGATSVVALAGGIGFALAARNDYDDLEADGCDQTACAGVDGRVDTMEHKALAADVLFGASAVAAGVAVFLYLGSGGAEQAPVSVTADPHGAHVWLGGHF
jgi:hypothetical protein